MDLGKEDSLHRWDNLDYREPWARQDDAKESRTRNLHTNAADKARAGMLAVTLPVCRVWSRTVQPPLDRYFSYQGTVTSHLHVPSLPGHFTESLRSPRTITPSEHLFLIAERMRGSVFGKY